MKKIFFFSILFGSLFLFINTQAQHKELSPKKQHTTSEKKVSHHTQKKTQTQTITQNKGIPISNLKTTPQYPIEHGKNNYPIEHGKNNYPIEHGTKEYPIEHGKNNYPIEHGTKAQTQQNSPA